MKETHLVIQYAYLCIYTSDSHNTVISRDCGRIWMQSRVQNISHYLCRSSNLGSCITRYVNCCDISLKIRGMLELQSQWEASFGYPRSSTIDKTSVLKQAASAHGSSFFPTLSRDPFHPSYLLSVKDASADTQSRYSAPRESDGWHKHISREQI